MADKNIKGEKKKPKKAVDTKVTAPSSYIRPIVTQPEIVTKKKKER